VEILIVCSVLFGLLSIFFVGRTVGCVRRGRFIRASGSSIGSLASLSITAAAALTMFSYYSYGRLTEERVISSIEFRRLAPDLYQARLMTDGDRDRLFELSGDEWQIDARIVNWTPPATILGLDPIYRL
jgi:hypothetical protein